MKFKHINAIILLHHWRFSYFWRILAIFHQNGLKTAKSAKISMSKSFLLLIFWFISKLTFQWYTVWSYCQNWNCYKVCTKCTFFAIFSEKWPKTAKISQNINFQTLFLMWFWISVKFAFQRYIIWPYLQNFIFHLYGAPGGVTWGSKWGFPHILGRYMGA